MAERTVAPNLGLKAVPELCSGTAGSAGMNIQVYNPYRPWRCGDVSENRICPRLGEPMAGA